MQNFKFQNRNFEIRIGYLEAMEVLPTRFNIYLMNLVSDLQKTNDTVLNILINDETCVSLMYYYLQKASDMPYEKFLECLEPTELAAFKEAFWEEVLNFSGPLKAPVLRQFQEETRKELKNPSLGKLPSESSPEV